MGVMKIVLRMLIALIVLGVLLWFGEVADFDVSVAPGYPFAPDVSANPTGSSSLPRLCAETRR
jgi:hypothetical protein